MEFEKFMAKKRFDKTFEKKQNTYFLESVTSQDFCQK